MRKDGIFPKRAKTKAGRLAQTRPAVGKGKAWLLSVGAVSCVAIAGFLATKHLWRSDEAPPEQPTLKVDARPPVAAEKDLSQRPVLPPDTAATSPRPETPPPEPAVMRPEAGSGSDQTAESLKKEMLAVAGRLLADLPDNPAAIGLMGMAHGRIGNTAAALKYWKECLARAPHRADVYDAMGLVYFKKGEYERAVTLWRKALEIAPKGTSVRYRLSLALQGLGKIEEAVTALEEDLRISPDAARSYFLRGQLLLQLGEYAKAREDFEAGIEIQPDEMDAYHGLATACERLDQKEQAREYWREFRKRKAEYWTAHMQRRRVESDLDEMRWITTQMYADAGRVYARHGFPQQAETLWQRAVALDQQNTPCRELLASLYRSTGRAEKALEVCMQLLDIRPDYPAYYLSVGSLQAALKHPDLAEKAFRKVIELAPDGAVGYRALAGLYLNTNRLHAKARKLAEAAVRLEPTAPNYFLLGLTCGRTGDQAGALAAMDRATKLAPDDNQYRKAYQMLRERK